MKLSKEVKIALVSIATVVAFILVANFLKSRNILKPESTYYAYYDDAHNLTASCAVFFKGMKVGRVSDLEFTNPKNPKIKVTISLNENLEIPEKSIARIVTADVMGTKMIELVFSDETEILKNGSDLIGEIQPDVVGEVLSELMPVKNKIEKLAGSLDSLISTLNAMFNEQTQRQLQNSISNLSASLNNVKRLTSTANTVMSEQRQNLEKILQNFAKISENLEHANLPKTVNSLEKTLAQTQDLIQKINEGDGTAARLMNDQKLYEELSESAENLSKLLEDIKANPKRYVHFSLFGKKKDK